MFQTRLKTGTKDKMVNNIGMIKEISLNMCQIEINLLSNEHVKYQR